MTTMAKRTASALITLIMLISLIPATVFAAGTSGWQKESGTWYYYKDGKKVSGWVKDGGKWYYCTPAMVDVPSYEIDGKIYVFNNDGSMTTKTGLVTIKYEGYGYKFYVKKGGIATTGWKQISGKWYYFEPEGGFAITSDMVPRGHEIDGTTYYFDSKGVWITKGWYSYKGEGENTNWLYLQKGVPVTGWKQIDKKWYYFDDYGTMYADDWHEEGDGDWYYFDKSGAMVTNKWVKDMSSSGEFRGWCYQGKDGKTVLGWLKLNKKWYYLDGDYGYCLMNTSKEIGGKVYNFDKDGVCLNP